MSNGGLSGIGAGLVNLPAISSASSAEKSKQVASDRASASSDSDTAPEALRTAHTTGKALNVAA
jgi:hypothetical protein